MNDKLIAELAHKANMTVFPSGLEKFVVLIVKECVRCVTQPTIQAEFPHDIAIREVQNVLANDMKFHFGVE